MKPIFVYIRQQEISSFHYIYDSLIQADNYAQCEQHAKNLVESLEKMFFVINNEKSA